MYGLPLRDRSSERLDERATGGHFVESAVTGIRGGGAGRPGEGARQEVVCVHENEIASTIALQAEIPIHGHHLQGLPQQLRCECPLQQVRSSINGTPIRSAAVTLGRYGVLFTGVLRLLRTSTRNLSTRTLIESLNTARS
jgi:hypothetical protein